MKCSCAAFGEQEAGRKEIPVGGVNALLIRGERSQAENGQGGLKGAPGADEVGFR